MAQQPHDDAEATRPVRVIEHLWLQDFPRVSQANTSKTLEETLGRALHADIGGVVIINRGATAVHVNPVGAATTSYGGLAQNESLTVFGDKARLDLLEAISATSSVNIDVAEYIKKPSV